MTVAVDRRRALPLLTALLVLLAGAVAPAQTPGQAPARLPDVQRLVLLAGRSTVIQPPFDIQRFQFADPAVADGLAVSRRELLVTAKKAGTISLLLWSGGRLAAQYEVVVESGEPGLEATLRALFPGENLGATQVGAAIVVSGQASSQAVADRVVEVAKASGLATNVISLLRVPPGAAATAEGPSIQQQLVALFPGEDLHVMRTGRALILSGAISSSSTMARIRAVAAASEPDSQVIDLMRPRDDSAVQQVLLQVRIAEVGRTALLEAGLNVARTQIDPETGRVTPRDVTGQSSTQQFTDAMNLVLFYNPEGASAFLKALQQSGSFRTLAEPNLIAYNGREAKFLSGGELPIVIPGTAGSAPQIQWKEYGVRLGFQPTIVGDRIHLKVRPEVSLVDQINSVNVNGTVVPALSTRYAETEVELRDGQSFAIAGLLNRNENEDRAGVAGLSRIPLLGYLFRSKRKSNAESELLVLVTPKLVQPLNPGQLPPLPAIRKDGGGW